MAPPRRNRTGPRPSLAPEAFVGPRTLESRMLPVAVVVAFAALLVIQGWLAIAS